MQVKIEESWRQRLQKEFDSAYFEKLTNFVRYEYQHYRVFPPGRLIFNAFNLCPFDKTKVVIIGQDPYQLLNATLTVREGQAGSHQRQGWEQFTDAVIRVLAQERTGLVFILWGSYAQSKAYMIDQRKHLVLKSVHPSPLSAHRGFFGNHQFSQTNAYLVKQGLTPIQW